MKVLVADDHWMIRSSLRHAIEEIDQSFGVLEAATFADIQRSLRSNHDIDFIFIDLVMPGLSEFDGIRRLRSRYPDIPIAVISVHEDRDYVLQAITEGAVAYIPKSAEGSELVRALRVVLHGDVYFPREILRGGANHLPGTEPTRRRPQASNGELTKREQEIHELIKGGSNSSEVASALGLAANTVRVHLRNINLKLQLMDSDQEP